MPYSGDQTAVDVAPAHMECLQDHLRPSGLSRHLQMPGPKARLTPLCVQMPVRAAGPGASGLGLLGSSAVWQEPRCC